MEVDAVAEGVQKSGLHWYFYKMFFSFCPQTDHIKGQRGIDKGCELGQGVEDDMEGGKPAEKDNHDLEGTKQYPEAFRRTGDQGKIKQIHDQGTQTNKAV